MKKRKTTPKTTVVNLKPGQLTVAGGTAEMKNFHDMQVKPIQNMRQLAAGRS